MDFLPSVILSLSVVLIAAGSFVLVANLTKPNLLDSPVMRRLVTGPRLQPSSQNRSLMGTWGVLIGAYFLLSVTGYKWLSYAAFAAWLPLALIVLRRIFWSRSEA